MSLNESFEQAALRVKTLSEKPSNEDLLKLYSLYKQGSKGPVTGKRPGMINVVGRAKYDAWAALGAMSPEEAMQSYITLVDELVAEDK